MATSACGRILRDAAQDARLLRMTRRSCVNAIPMCCGNGACRASMGIWHGFESSRRRGGAPIRDEILTMMDLDLGEFYEMLQGAARSVGAEVTSPWFYLQLGLILAAAGIAFGVGAAVRSRVDTTSLGMGWPAPLRLFLRVLVGSASTAAFAILMIVA